MPRRRARTPEARENQLISLAVDLAEKQLMEGTASAMVITHYLKLASSKESLERAKLEEEVKLLKAKTETYEANIKNDEKYDKVLRAISIYSGESDDIYED